MAEAAPTHQGSCHCGAVRFEVDTALEEVMECNCSHCYRKGLMLSFVPAEAFRLQQGEEALSEHRFNRHSIQHLFCRTCGVQPFARGEAPGGAKTVAVNVRVLQDVEPWSLTPARVDGRSF